MKLMIALAVLVLAALPARAEEAARLVADCGADLQVVEQHGKLLGFIAGGDVPIPLFVSPAESAEDIKLVSTPSARVTIYIQKEAIPPYGYPGVIRHGRVNLGLYCTPVDFRSLN